MSYSIFSVILYCLLLLSGTAFAGNAAENELIKSFEVPAVSGIVKREEIPELKIVVLHLKNGMKVCLKKTESEEDMVVRLTALGGYSSLPEGQRASGQFASQAAIRSGVGNYFFDQLHAMLFDKSIEFDSEILPFSRYVGGTTSMGEVEILMNLIHAFFKDQRLTEHSFKKVLEKAKEQLTYRSKNSARFLEDTDVEFNNPNLPALYPITEKQIDRADYKTAVKFFKGSFLDPSEFSCVISGSFDMEKMVSLVDKYFATIPKPENYQSAFKIPILPKKDKGIKTKVVKNQRNVGEAITILTFPVQVSITEENFIPIENITQLIFSRLKHVLREHYQTAIINVTTEYPLYPCLSAPTIKIQYFSDPKQAAPMKQILLSELKKLQNESVSQEEIQVMNRKYKKAHYLHEKDNYYWLMVLSNYLLWDWNTQALLKDLTPLVDKEEIHKGLKTYFSVENYTMITAHP